MRKTDKDVVRSKHLCGVQVKMLLLDAKLLSRWPIVFPNCLWALVHLTRLHTYKMASFLSLIKSYRPVATTLGHWQLQSATT